jgi:hypothetical protein
MNQLSDKCEFGTESSAAHRFWDSAYDSMGHIHTTVTWGQIDTSIDSIDSIILGFVVVTFRIFF